nr:NADH dehydrogenase subunit 6 [Apterichtus klazingai]
MVYVVSLFVFFLLSGLVVVAASPSPFFAAFGLVLAAAGACGILASHGGSFISLVLFLIYLGGMLVVFAYSAALAADPYPEGWGEGSVLVRVVVCYSMVFVGALLGGKWSDVYFEVVECRDFAVLRSEFCGVSFVYSSGGGMLVLCAWALFLTLFIVLELAWGARRGALRAI